MSAKSTIEWTDSTWNPIVGCSVVSPGCTNCYAMRRAERLEAMATKPDGRGNPYLLHYAGTTTRDPTGRGYDWMDHPVWSGKVAMALDDALLKPLRRQKPTTYFVNSMGDLFHESVPDEWIDRVFAVMALAPQHTFQVLTKRSGRMRSYFEGRRKNFGRASDVLHEMNHSESEDRAERAFGILDLFDACGTPAPNVWLGVSAEDQPRADERVPDLLATPAAVRFVSAEPLLGRIDFERLGTLESIRAAMPTAIEREERGRPRSGDGSICDVQIDAIGSSGSSITFFQTPDHMGGFTAAAPRQWPRLDWVVVGGESGPGARPMHPDWARSIRGQCAAAGVPFFFKQWGAYRPAFPQYAAEFGLAEDDMLLSGRDFPMEGVLYRDGYFYDGLTHQPHVGAGAFWMENVGKKAAGRLLDGVLHDAMPARAAT